MRSLGSGPTSRSGQRHKFGRVADYLLFYSKRQRPVWHQYMTHSPDYIAAKYAYDDNDGRREYSRDNMTSPQQNQRGLYEWRGYSPPAKGWRYKPETMQRLHDEGRIYYPTNSDSSPDHTKRPCKKRYLSESKGPLVGNVWSDIPPVNSQAPATLRRSY